ncbi:hypothetical protein SELMODRAFT_110901, partial [Selaginella moellendorffii]
RRWWSRETIAVVTGSNKGLGLAIARGLAMEGVTTILTARDELRGWETVDSLKQDERIDPSLIHFHRLDVTSASSIQEFARWIKTKFGGLDILVNNAGISGATPGALTNLENSKAVIDTNYLAVRKLTESLISLMRPSSHGARIVNVSSGTSRLDALQNQALAHKISNIDELSMEAIDEIVKEYLEDVEHGRVIEKGWSRMFGAYDYCFSKIALNAYTRVLARDLSKLPEGHKIFANCMCPGVTSTAMSRNNGHSAEVGADTAIWLALRPAIESSSGRFFSKRNDVGFDRIPFYIEKVVYTSDLEDFMECMRKQERTRKSWREKTK